MSPFFCTYKDVVLDSYDVAAPEVGRRQRGHEELFVLPVVRRVALDLAATHRGQLPRLRLHDFAPCDVLDGLK